MKKRFKNILTKSPKKNGLLLCICAICITLISGMLIGCSAIKKELPEETVQIESISQSLENNTNTQTDSADDNSTDLSNDAPTDDSGTDIISDIQSGNIENPPEQSVELEENTYKSILWGKVILYVRIWQMRV